MLKTIRRRRHVSQSMQQEGGGGGGCVELGQFGLETELERLKRDRNVLMSEIVRLKQQQQNSRELVIAIEDRLQTTERKQQQMMNFLAKALKNPCFIQNFAQKSELAGVEIGRKRRLAASPSVENLQEVPTTCVLDDSASQDPGELVTMESDFESLFSAAAVDNESSSDINYSNLTSIPTSCDGNLGTVNETIWEELWSEELIEGNPEEEVVVGNESEIDVEVEDLVSDPSEWGEDLQDLVDQMGFLIKSKP